MRKICAALLLAAAWPLAIADESTAEPSAARVDAAFAKADRNRDGVLTPAEASLYGIDPATFEAANPDRDGTLDRAELVAAVKARFEKANPDRDRTLDWQEAQAAGIRSKSVFEAANPDRDGTLDLAEYLEALVAQAK